MSEAEQKGFIESLPDDSACKKHFNLIKNVNDITRSLQNSNLNYLRMKFKDTKSAQQGK